MTDHRHRPSGRQIALLLLVATLLGCAVPTDSSPQSVAVQEDFADLLDPAPTTEPTTTTLQEATRQVSLFFIVDDLVVRQFTLIPLSRAQSLTAVLNDLVAGTRQENHRNAIPSGVQVVEARIDPDRRVATIVLADNTLFTGVEGPDRRLAIAQFVFTATSGGFGVDAVRFEIDGNIRSVPTGSGSDTSEPVTRCDYARFAGDTTAVANCPTVTTTTVPPPSNGGNSGDPLGDVP